MSGEEIDMDMNLALSQALIGTCISNTIIKFIDDDNDMLESNITPLHLMMCISCCKLQRVAARKCEICSSENLTSYIKQSAGLYGFYS